MVMILPTISLISIMLIILNFMLAKKDYLEREKPSPFECGFDPISSARLPFSIQFFLIAVIFLIFDIELTLILPAITSLLTCSISIISMVLSLFLIILMAGLLLEWKMGALEWYI